MKCKCTGCGAMARPGFGGWCKQCGLAIAEVFGTSRMPSGGYCSCHQPAVDKMAGVTAPWARAVGQ